MNFVKTESYYYDTKQAGDISNSINEEILAINVKLLEYKCISTKQHKENLKKNVLHKK